MKNLIISATWIIIVALLISNAALAGNKGVSFEKGNWNEIKNKAKKEQKMIFVKAYANWCLPCKQMDKYVFVEQQVMNYYNANFINYAVNVDTDEGQYFASLYDISTLPDLLYFDANGRLLRRELGQKSAEAILSMGKNALHRAGYQERKFVPVPETENVLVNIEKEGFIHKNNNETTKTRKKNDRRQVVGAKYSGGLINMQRQYNNGHRSTAFLRDFAYQLQQEKQPYTKVVNQYLTKKWWTFQQGSEESMQLVYNFADDFNTNAIHVLLRNKKRYVEKFGQQNVEKKVRAALFNNISIASISKNEKLFKRTLSIARKAKFKDKKDLLYNLKAAYYDGHNNHKKYMQVTRNYMRAYKGNDPAFYHRKAWDLIRSKETKTNLRLAKKYVEKSIKVDPQFYNHETYTYLLQKLGKRNKAKRIARKAIALGQQQRRDISKVQTMLSNLNARKTTGIRIFSVGKY